ncbi:MAG: SDR family oxidoreductase [Sphingomonadaceae bacterium]|jgi:NAD(P)-dependent dehydrogenase (short-subunit alcohol dehydrogenase family)
MPMTKLPRRKTMITGAAGGMGRACARLFGATDDLVLTDVSAGTLDAFAAELRNDNNNVVTQAGDLADEAVIASLVDEVSDGAPFALVHTAGLSPSLAGWEAIMQVNLVATEKLLRALDPVLVPGCVLVLIASSAGHMMPPNPQIDGLLADPLADGFIGAIEQTIKGMGGESSPGGMGGISYTLSKRAIHTMTQARALEWGPRGVRVVSISPGMILTPMGKKEVETPGGAALLNATPVGRSGMPMDIALAARFLCSDQASFISGTDLLVDGGGTAGMKKMMAAAQG